MICYGNMVCIESDRIVSMCKLKGGLEAERQALEASFSGQQWSFGSVRRIIVWGNATVFDILSSVLSSSMQNVAQ
jgi:hypothetical protein